MERIVDKIRNRISIENIVVNVEGRQLVFKFALSDEKQLNIAAGKIHRAVSQTQGHWTLVESILTLKLPAGTADYYKLGDIQEAFKTMVS